MSTDIYISNELFVSATLEQTYIILQSLETKFKIKEVLTLQTSIKFIYTKIFFPMIITT